MFRPWVYQGDLSPVNYFEGWYFKLVNPEGDHVWSVIPGISYSDDNHAFIQLIQAVTGRTHYLRYPIEDFSYRTDLFQVGIGNSFFSDNYIKLELKNDEIEVIGKIDFSMQAHFPQSLWAPGIMGWYSYVPGMECYHGVVSMHHQLNGVLHINAKPIEFTGGAGYIEKDWGSSMPSDWIWLQSNHFEGNERSSFMLSVARIPWRKGYFPGFLSYVYHEGKVYRFATYNRSKIERISVNDEEVLLNIQNRKYVLSVRAIPNRAGKLKAPRHGNMDREIFESLNSVVHVELSDKKGNIIFSSRGSHAGLEIVGDVASYYK